MNRRGFFSTLAKAVAGFTILPAATTYARNWTPTENLWVPNPEWENADYEIKWASFAGIMAKALVDHPPYLTLLKGGKFPEGAGITTRAGGSSGECFRNRVSSLRLVPEAVDS